MNPIRQKRGWPKFSRQSPSRPNSVHKSGTKALGKTRETIKELHGLATRLTGLVDVAMTVPLGGAVVVPHGSTVVSYEDVNVDIDSEEVRSVDKNEVRAGCGEDNPKTK